MDVTVSSTIQLAITASGYEGVPIRTATVWDDAPTVTASIPAESYISQVQTLTTLTTKQPSDTSPTTEYAVTITVTVPAETPSSSAQTDGPSGFFPAVLYSFEIIGSFIWQGLAAITMFLVGIISLLIINNGAGACMSYMIDPGSVVGNSDDPPVFFILGSTFSVVEAFGLPFLLYNDETIHWGWWKWIGFILLTAAAIMVSLVLLVVLILMAIKLAVLARRFLAWVLAWWRDRKNSSPANDCEATQPRSEYQEYDDDAEVDDIILDKRRA